MSTKTQNSGANDERTAILARLRRDQRAYLRNSPNTTAGIISYLDMIIKWIEGRAERNSAKAGGLGKKYKPTVKPSLMLSPRSLAAKLAKAKIKLPAASPANDQWVLP